MRGVSASGRIVGEPRDWAAPDEEGFAFINDLLRPIGLYLCGRKMYETIAIWEAPDVIPGLTSAMLNFAQICKRPTRSSIPNRRRSSQHRRRISRQKIPHVHGAPACACASAVRGVAATRPLARGT